MSSSDTTPPEVNITEVSIEHMDGFNYWRFSGNVDDGSPIQNFVISIQMGHSLDSYNHYEIDTRAIETDGSFTTTVMIHPAIANTLREDISVVGVQIVDTSGNATVFDVAQLGAVNALIPQTDYQVNPGSADTTPPEVNITEVSIEHMDGFNYWRFSGNVDDGSPIQNFVISIQMGHSLDSYNHYEIDTRAIETDGSFTTTVMIHPAIANTLREDISVVGVQIVDTSGNATVFDVAQLGAVNALIPQTDYQVNPGSADTTAPLLEFTEVRIEEGDNGHFWRFSGNIEDASPIQSLTIAIQMSGYEEIYSIDPRLIEPDGSFTISFDISSDIPNTVREDIFISWVQIVDTSGNEAVFDAAQLGAVTALIPQVDYQVNPGSTDTTAPLLEFTEVRIEERDNGHFWRFSGNIEDASPIQSLTIAIQMSGYEEIYSIDPRAIELMAAHNKF